MLVIAAAVFAVVWLVAELGGRRGLRLAFGFACIGSLALALFFHTWRNALIEAEYHACMRLLGETLEKGDLEKARKAVVTYNQGEGNLHPAMRMLCECWMYLQKNRVFA